MGGSLSLVKQLVRVPQLLQVNHQAQTLQGDEGAATASKVSSMCCHSLLNHGILVYFQPLYVKVWGYQVNTNRVVFSLPL